MKFKIALSKAFLYIILLFLKLLSHNMSLSIGRFAGKQLFKRMPERAKVATDNLKLIYGDKLSEGSRQTLAQKNFEHLGGSLFEILYTLASPKRLDKLITVVGHEHMEKALAKNKGAIIFSGHVGNFFLLASTLCRKFHAKFLYRKPSRPLEIALYDWLLARLGIQTIADNPRHLCAYHSYAQLKKQGVLGVLIDQVETGGLYVDFMGQPAGSTKGAGNMALKTGAPLVPAYCQRLENNKLKVTIEPEFIVQPSGQYDQDLEAIVAGTNQLVGNWVNQVQEQWFWGHRRWRKWRK